MLLYELLVMKIWALREPDVTVARKLH